MSLPATKLREAQAPNGLGLSLWWTPARITYHDGQNWRTVPWQKFNPKNPKMQTLAISPVGTDGLCRFVAWDVDQGGQEAVRKVLAALSQGCVPLVSISGGRQGQGYHIWLYLDRPLPVEAAVAFAKAVRAKAGVLCEIRPTGVNSLCLKWPGQRHPETGKAEVFVPLDDLGDTERLDTPLILQMLAEGHYRTPAEVFEDYAKQHGKATAKKQGSPGADTTWFARGNHVDATWTPTECLQGGTKLVRSLDELAKREELVHEIMRLAGRKPVRLGRGFKCILPQHEERHPSGSFFRAKDGHILYGDFHARDGEATYTLGEVYHALATGKVTKLRPCDKARWLAMLGLRCGFATGLVLRQREKAKAAADVLAELQQGKQAEPTHQDAPTSSWDKTPPTRGYYSSGWLQSQGNGWLHGAEEWAIINRVWEAVCEEVQIQAFAGFEEAALSKRFLARRAGVRPELANRAVNLLCVLGLIGKVPNSGGMKGDRFTLTGVDGEEAKRRFGLLFPDGAVNLREFNRALVAAKLGEEVAAAVFRRGAEEPAANPCQTHGQGMAIPFERYSKGIAEVFGYLSEAPPLPLPKSAQGNPFVEAIQQAEREGNQERVDALLRGLAAWLAAGRPPEVAAYLGHT